MMTGAVFVLLNESHVTQVIQTSHGLVYPTLGYNNSLNQTRLHLRGCGTLMKIPSGPTMLQMHGLAG